MVPNGIISIFTTQTQGEDILRREVDVKMEQCSYKLRNTKICQ